MSTITQRYYQTYHIEDNNIVSILEWTILQLCKGPCTSTTFLTFSEINTQPAYIYLSILQHARSSKYSDPICLRINTSNKTQLFKRVGDLPASFKEIVSNVNPKDWASSSAKQLYWNKLSDINDIFAVSRNIKKKKIEVNLIQLFY